MKKIKILIKRFDFRFDTKNIEEVILPIQKGRVDVELGGGYQLEIIDFTFKSVEFLLTNPILTISKKIILKDKESFQENQYFEDYSIIFKILLVEGKNE